MHRKYRHVCVSVKVRHLDANLNIIIDHRHLITTNVVCSSFHPPMILEEFFHVIIVAKVFDLLDPSC